MNIDDINYYNERHIPYDFSFIAGTQVYVVAKNPAAGVVCTIPIKNFRSSSGKITGDVNGKIIEFDIDRQNSGEITEEEFLQFLESGGSNG